MRIRSIILTIVLLFLFVPVLQAEQDDRFLPLTNGIVKDTRTGLEWIAGPDKDTNWVQAILWVKDLNFDSGGWRMPSIDELESLYLPITGKRNMTPHLKTTGWWVWSGETEGPNQAKYYDFYNRTWGWQKKSFAQTVRAFAVRSRGDG